MQLIPLVIDIWLLDRSIEVKLCCLTLIVDDFHFKTPQITTAITCAAVTFFKCEVTGLIHRVHNLVLVGSFKSRKYFWYGFQ